ncbi:MAG TPA: hypothetical protein VFP44_22825 [Usitatibacter sp.]|nr:hypothetical protein [Usitatibacter sp.]
MIARLLACRHLCPGGPLREVALREATMRREFAVGYRKASYLSPAAVRVLDEIKSRAGAFQGVIDGDC